MNEAQHCSYAPPCPATHLQGPEAAAGEPGSGPGAGTGNCVDRGSLPRGELQTEGWPGGSRLLSLLMLRAACAEGAELLQLSQAWCALLQGIGTALTGPALGATRALLAHSAPQGAPPPGCSRSLLEVSRTVHAAS